MNVDLTKLPGHIAIIMDGNGRWAKQRSLPRIEGHRAGTKVVDEIVTAANDLGVRYLTLYAFSVENWLRPHDEVMALMDLLQDFLIEKKPKMLANRIRLGVIGDVEMLPQQVRQTLLETIAATQKGDRLTLTLALSYSSRDEIVRAVQKIAAMSKSGHVPAIDVDSFNSFLDTGYLPDVDLMIRTSGEMRISNFLLWQAAYAELLFTNTLWPDFTAADLCKAIAAYQDRERRFGMTSEQVSSDSSLAESRPPHALRDC